MAIESFDDLLRLLREHPEWRDDLRRQVLTDGLLELPRTVAQLAEAQTRTEQRLETVAQRLEALAEAQTRTEQRLGSLVEQVSEMAGHVEWLKGDAIERRYRERAAGYFGRIARRIHTLTQDELEAMLGGAVEAATLTEVQAQEVRLADAVIRGRRGDRDVYLVVEASWGIGIDDVKRAQERAGLLASLGLEALAVVAGTWVTPDARRAAPQLDVWQVADGAVVPPDGIST